jgi:hypothetical protein
MYLRAFTHIPNNKIKNVQESLLTSELKASLRIVNVVERISYCDESTLDNLL